MFVNILILAAIIERIWEHLQQLLGEKGLSLQAKLLGSAVLSVFASASLKLDLLYALELTAAVTLPGMVLTGFAVGLGSNLVHDLQGIVSGFSGRLKQKGIGG